MCVWLARHAERLIMRTAGSSAGLSQPVWLSFSAQLSQTPRAAFHSSLSVLTRPGPPVKETSQTSLDLWFFFHRNLLTIPHPRPIFSVGLKQMPLSRTDYRNVTYFRGLFKGAGNFVEAALKTGVSVVRALGVRDI